MAHTIRCTLEVELPDHKEAIDLVNALQRTVYRLGGRIAETPLVFDDDQPIIFAPRRDNNGARV